MHVIETILCRLLLTYTYEKYFLFLLPLKKPVSLSLPPSLHVQKDFTARVRASVSGATNGGQATYLRSWSAVQQFVFLSLNLWIVSITPVFKVRDMLTWLNWIGTLHRKRLYLSLWHQVQSAFKKKKTAQTQILILAGQEITELGDLFDRTYNISDLTEDLETAQCLANAFKRETHPRVIQWQLQMLHGCE